MVSNNPTSSNFYFSGQPVYVEFKPPQRGIFPFAPLTLLHLGRVWRDPQQVQDMNLQPGVRLLTVERSLQYFSFLFMKCF